MVWEQKANGDDQIAFLERLLLGCFSHVIIFQTKSS
jgi:hypothetical protein